ncbi:hypothetical protein [Sporichthya sp.]|uniref:hypothetical protein n=1 Tax=Sporichthya sp. TaxID=65475 RepID=UPI0017FDEF4D|nr:hypothetical protein [Sporichthya sp.]MBA3742735.1 hypothetical protein [Sporichthya sp.]
MLAAVVCPQPPLLIPEIAAGAAAELDELRAACDAALKAGLAAGPERVVLVGPGRYTHPWPADAADGLADLGMPKPAGDLPLSLTVGRWLLERAGWDGPRSLHSIAAAAAADECAALGAQLAGGPPALLLVTGDASARRTVGAPGHLDQRAEAFDADVAAALAKADVGALLELDAALAADLLAAGRPAWQVLAGAVHAAGGFWAGTLHHDAAPYGVGYLVASWLRA